MSDQRDLFDVGERDIHGEKLPTSLCIPAQRGTGPKGETCGTCKHLVRIRYANTYRKCGLMKKYWTGGAATDIKAGWAACGKWEPVGEGD